MSCSAPAESTSRMVQRRIQPNTSFGKAANARNSPVAFSGGSLEDLPKMAKSASDASCDDDVSTVAFPTPTRMMSLEIYDSEDEDSSSWVRPWMSPEARSYRSNLSSSPLLSSDSDEDSEAWRRVRTPSPEMTYCSITGRSLPPPSLLMLPAGPRLPATQPPASPPNLERQEALFLERPVRALGPMTPSAKSGTIRATTQEDIASADQEPGSTLALSQSVSWADQLDDDEDESDADDGRKNQEDQKLGPPQGEGSLSLLTSIGAEGHSAGTCRPCAHIWREAGCSKGFDCAYCHSCGREDWRRYKRMIKLRKEQKEEKQAARGRRYRVQRKIA